MRKNALAGPKVNGICSGVRPSLHPSFIQNPVSSFCVILLTNQPINQPTNQPTNISLLKVTNNNLKCTDRQNKPHIRSENLWNKWHIKIIFPVRWSSKILRASPYVDQRQHSLGRETEARHRPPQVSPHPTTYFQLGLGLGLVTIPEQRQKRGSSTEIQTSWKEPKEKPEKWISRSLI